MEEQNIIRTPETKRKDLRVRECNNLTFLWRSDWWGLFWMSSLVTVFFVPSEKGWMKCCAFLTWGMAQKRKIAGSLKADMYWRESGACLRALVIMSLRHCTARSALSSSLKSCFTRKDLHQVIGRKMNSPKAASEETNLPFVYGVREIKEDTVPASGTEEDKGSEVEETHLQLFDVFSPNLTGPKHSWSRPHVDVFQVIPYDVRFLDTTRAKSFN